MIVISGALAVVAFVLLIAGLVADGLGLVYASIAVSLISAIFLGVGAYQRRGEEVAPRAGVEPATGGLGAEPVRVGADTAVFSDTGDEASVRIASGDGGSGGGTVLVVPGRPRYHVEGCRYLAGKDGEERTLAEARDEGYTACGICRPDENVTEAAPQLALVGGGAADDDDTDATDDEDVKPAHTTRTRRTAAAGTTRKTAARKTATGKKASAKKTTSKKTATKQAPARKTAATRTPAKKTTATKKAPATKKAAATKTAAKKTSAKKAAPARSTAKKTTAKKTAKKITRR